MVYSKGARCLPPARKTLCDVVEDRVVDDVPEDTLYTTDDPLPFRHDTSRETIAAALLPHTTGEPRTYAVYVLECRQTSDAGSALQQGVSHNSVSRYQNAGDCRRVIYVGMAQSVVDRLDQHLNEPGREGANFTALFPPLRVLTVGWFSHKEQAEQAEALAAGMLEEEYPNDFVAYPG